jgi:hypothetical protein
MKPYAAITCGVLSPLDLSGDLMGRAVLKMMGRHPLALPTHVGNVEPMRTPYEGINGGISHWADPFLWKNKKTKISGSIWFGTSNRHGAFYVSQDLEKASLTAQVPWVELLLDACRTITADFGYIHLTTKQELDECYEAAHAIDLGITTHELRKGLPNLCWGMYFGDPYRELSKRFEDLDLKAIRIVEGGVYVQLTDSLEDILRSYLKFNEERMRILNEMGANFLMTSGEGKWLPEFLFSNRMQSP